MQQHPASVGSAKAVCRQKTSVQFGTAFCPSQKFFSGQAKHRLFDKYLFEVHDEHMPVMLLQTLQLTSQSIFKLFFPTVAPVYME
ncbi:MAG: hypothetical protein J6L82_10765 [Alphaproteobacteria bacterium]|nr:hypothetical protein [Alphaproteobacteria bacterium]